MRCLSIRRRVIGLRFLKVLIWNIWLLLVAEQAATHPLLQMCREVAVRVVTEQMFLANLLVAVHRLNLH
jgi:hypothetical protein